MIGVFTGLSFLGFIVLIVWSSIGNEKARRNNAFLICLFLTLCWALLLYFGISHIVGLLSMYAGIAGSTMAILFPVLSKRFCKRTMNNLNGFTVLLKRGNLPDDDREVPNWLKIKNCQFDDINPSQNNVDEIVSLTSGEFNEFVSSSDNGLLFTYLLTLPEAELDRFYKYNDDVVKLDESIKAKSSKEQFQAAMKKAAKWDLTDEQKARASLEIPLMIQFSKNIYHQIIGFQEYVSQDYYDYITQNEFKMYEGHFVKIIWDEMQYIPNHLEQVLDHFKDEFYDEKNIEHKSFFKHLSKRFGLLIATLNRIVAETENRDSSLNWFTGKMLEYDLIDTVEISVGKSKALSSDQKLVNFLTLTFLGICDENEDNYLANLIHVVETLWEWYPVNRKACEYAMVEMMKSVAMKKVNKENANRFLGFFEELPRFYNVLSYDLIHGLKEVINRTLAHYKPLDNKVFMEDGVKNKIILLNYLVDMEDLYCKPNSMVS